jgi:hypothetical protein
VIELQSSLGLGRLLAQFGGVGSPALGALLAAIQHIRQRPPLREGSSFGGLRRPYAALGVPRAWPGHFVGRAL